MDNPNVTTGAVKAAHPNASRSRAQTVSSGGTEPREGFDSTPWPNPPDGGRLVQLRADHD